MAGRLPLFHGGGVTWDELAVFAGFALVIGLLTHWIDYRRGGSAGDNAQGDGGQEDRERAQADDRGEPRGGEIGNRVGPGRRLTLERLPEQ